MLSKLIPQFDRFPDSLLNCLINRLTFNDDAFYDFQLLLSPKFSIPIFTGEFSKQISFEIIESYCSSIELDGFIESFFPIYRSLN